MRRKFYRGKLATIVWDPTAGKPLAEFKGGHFTTEDERTAKILLGKGYIEVALKDEKPPILPEEPVKDIGNIKVLSGGMSEKVELANLEAAKEAEVPKATTGSDEGAGTPKTKKEGGRKKPIKRRSR